MSNRTIAVGDIHGCAKALHAMLAQIQPEKDDTLVLLGDCVDRGPDSRQVIDEVLALREKCTVVPLLGNHEEMMLNFLDGKPQPDNWLEVGGVSTVRSYSPRSDPEDILPAHIEYIRTWGDFYETPSHIFVHGGYDADSPLAKQHWKTMRWQSLKHHVPRPHISGKTAIVGHTSLKDGNVLDLGYLICIDTWCWGGGWLSALDSTTGQLWQVDREGRVRQDAAAAQAAKPA